jgi:hypothetical protein
VHECHRVRPRLLAVCVGLGAVLGDGVAFFDGAPVDLGHDIMPLWSKAPSQVKGLVDALGDAIGKAPLADLLGKLPLNGLPLPSAG